MSDKVGNGNDDKGLHQPGTSDNITEAQKKNDAENGQDALSQVAKNPPDVILLDVMMPQIDGWEILQALKLDEELGRIPVIVCSAWESADLAKSLGATEFLKKPITQERLLATIQALQL